MIVADMYYGGEALSAESPQSFTCPYCCKMGFTDASLHEHVTAEHTDVSVEVVSKNLCLKMYKHKRFPTKVVSENIHLKCMYAQKITHHHI